MNIRKMHAWLWNDKVKVKVHFEDLIHSILPVAFQKGFHQQLIMLECQSYPCPQEHQQSFEALLPRVIF